MREKYYIYKVNEIKSKRLNLLLYPSLLNDLKKIAAMKRTSVNDLINDVLTQYTDKNINMINEYNSVFKE
jgi:hypothetical protein